MTKYGQNFSFGAITLFKRIREQLLSMEQSYWGSVKYLLNFQVLRSRSPPDQIWGKLQFCSYNSIVMYQVGAFVNQIDLLG